MSSKPSLFFYEGDRVVHRRVKYLGTVIKVDDDANEVVVKFDALPNPRPMGVMDIRKATLEDIAQGRDG